MQTRANVGKWQGNCRSCSIIQFQLPVDKILAPADYRILYRERLDSLSVIVNIGDCRGNGINDESSIKRGDVHTSQIPIEGTCNDQAVVSDSEAVAEDAARGCIDFAGGDRMSWVNEADEQDLIGVRAYEGEVPVQNDIRGRGRQAY